MELVKDLGPQEGTKSAYKQFKGLVVNLKEMGQRTTGNWEPTGAAASQQGKKIAGKSLELLVNLRESKQPPYHWDRQEATHRKLLLKVQEFQELMNSQEKQVALDLSLQ